MRGLNLVDLQKHINRRQGGVEWITIKKEIDTLRSAWNWACQMMIVEGEFPFSGLVYPKGKEKLLFMTWAEIERKIKQGGDSKGKGLLARSRSSVKPGTVLGPG